MQRDGVQGGRLRVKVPKQKCVGCVGVDSQGTGDCLYVLGDCMCGIRDRCLHIVWVLTAVWSNVVDPGMGKGAINVPTCMDTVHELKLRAIWGVDSNTWGMTHVLTVLW